MIAHFTDLYNYNQWANERIIEALQRAKGGNNRCLQLMTHILSAQQAWLQRINGTPRTVALWDILPLTELVPLFAENHQHWRDFWQSFENDHFAKEISYTNSQGKAYLNNIKDIVTHAVNHATYHRAQINQLLRQNGYEPILTDYIAYRRVVTGQD